jgi:tetratricopeptide (TPR) repeat protein
MYKIKRKQVKKIRDLKQLAQDYQKAGDLQEAENIYVKMLHEQPHNADIYFNLGFIYTTKCQFDSAILNYQQALHFNPHLVDAYYNLGSIFQQIGRLDEATDHYQKVLKINPEHAMAYINLGSIFQQKGRFDDAIDFYQKALQFNPKLISGYNNLGLALQEKGQFDEAMSCHQKALSLDQNNATVHFNLGVLLLMYGDLKQGWREYEWRKKFKNYQDRNFTQPLWDGSEISGRTILIYSEKGFEGFGDTIQFIRYAPLIGNRGAKIIVECQKELKTLLRNVKGVQQVISYGDILPKFDVHCPFLSLPFVFNTTLEHIPSETPYITVNPLLVQKWRDKIQNDRSKLKIGLMWSGDLRHPRSQYRSCSLDIFSPLTEVNDISIYSLQKGQAAEQAKNPPEGMNLMDYTESFNDFSDTAALIENLDLVISVDTGVTHLAGALGKPVWTLLPFVPEWRWLLEREDSPWYPTMRLFRQTSPGNWKSIIARLLDNLHEKIARI